MVAPFERSWNNITFQIPLLIILERSKFDFGRFLIRFGHSDWIFLTVCWRSSPKKAKNDKLILNSLDFLNANIKYIFKLIFDALWRATLPQCHSHNAITRHSTSAPQRHSHSHAPQRQSSDPQRHSIQIWFFVVFDQVLAFSWNISCCFCWDAFTKQKYLSLFFGCLHQTTLRPLKA